MNKVLNFVAAALGKRQAKPAQWPVDHGQPIAAASGGGQEPAPAKAGAEPNEVRRAKRVP